MPPDETVTFGRYYALLWLPQRVDAPSNDSVYCLTTTCLHTGRVEDPLFKIRNCMNISGIRRQLLKARFFKHIHYRSRNVHESMNISQIKVEYVISFSDALFAFSITFMALSIQIPTFSGNIEDSELAIRLGQLLIPNLIHYIISFIVVGVYWISYHRIFEYIRRTNITLVWLNLLFLMFIALVGYFTGLLATYETHRIILISFSGIIAATGFVLSLIWWYAAHDRKLVDQDMNDHLIKYYLRRTYVSPLILLASIGISFINVQAAQYFWAVILPANIIIYMKHIPLLRRL
jgi:TMEM175 potassium channel family protein